MRKHVALILVLMITTSVATAQPGLPPDGGDPVDVPVTGLETLALAGAGVVYVVRKMRRRP